jgi:ribosome-associated translation inhibitor RaiA
MQEELRITFRDMPPSTAVEAKIREKVAWLEQFCGEVIGCRVMVEAPHRQHHQGRLYHVGIELRVPDAELVVSRNPAQHHAHEDVYVAVRDAFDAARRQLEDYERRRRGSVKTHAPASRAR